MVAPPTLFGDFFFPESSGFLTMLLSFHPLKAGPAPAIFDTLAARAAEALDQRNGGPPNQATKERLVPEVTWVTRCCPQLGKTRSAARSRAPVVT